MIGFEPGVQYFHSSDLFSDKPLMLKLLQFISRQQILPCRSDLTHIHSRIQEVRSAFQSLVARE